MNKFIKKFTAFELAAIKLSVFYVLIAMLISVIFSVAIFNISSAELGRGLGKTFKMINGVPSELLKPGMKSLERIRLEQIEEVNNNLKWKLTYFNLIILAISSGLSYFLAKKTLDPLEQATEAQKRFTADASHELRTPLAAMRAEIEVALRGRNLSNEDAKRLLESNIEEIAKLESLSDALLKLARYQHNGFEFNKIDISEVVVEAYEKIENLAKKKNVIFENKISSAFVFGDKPSLIELIIILLDNAVKYSEKYSKIEIEVEEKQNKVLIKIKDYGIGIKASDLPHIFERFYRADSSRAKTKINGYGLGLSLAKQIVNLHNGEIFVSSTVGKGTQFFIKLPSAK